MKNTKLAIVVLLAVTFLAFFPALKNGFVNWDDEYYVLHNELVREHSVSNTVKIFSERYFSDYLPLTMLSYNIEHAVFGFNPFVYHLDNLLLHLLNCLLVFYFILLLCGNNRVAFLVALLFGIHPMHVESVAWVSERKDVLYTFFYLSAVILYLQYIKSNNKWRLLVSSLLFVLACLSKAMAMTLPFVFLLLDYYFERRPWKKNILEKSVFWVIALVFAGIGFLTQKEHGAVSLAGLTSFGTNFVHALYNTGFYLIKLVIPVNLSNVYNYPSSLLLFLPPILTALAVFVYLVLKPTKIKIFGAGLFLLTVFPVLQLIPFGMGGAADRYTYLPYIGLFFIVAELIETGYNRFEADHGRMKKFTIMLVGIFAVLFLLTFNRCEVWKDSRTLWADALTKNNSSAVAVYNIAQFSAEDGDYDSAIKGFTRVLELEPDNEYPLRERIKAYINTGKYDLARADIKKIKNSNSVSVIVVKELNELLSRMEKKGFKGISKKAAILTEEARTLLSRGDIRAAIQKYSEALAVDPDDSESYNNRGVAYNLAGDSVKALGDLSMAISNKSHVVPEYYFNRGNIYRKMNRITEALSDYNIAIAKEKSKSEYFNNRGICYFMLKDSQKALADFDMALKLDPLNISAENNRGKLMNIMIR